MMLFGFWESSWVFGPGGSFFVWGGEVCGSDGRVVGHQRCAGWLQGLSFLVMCREVVWHRRCVGCGWGEFFAVCREGIGE